MVGNSEQLLQVGTELQNGKYVVKRQLSSGGFGNTYVIVDKQFEDEFALKEFFIKGINDRTDDNTTVSISNAANTKLFESQKEKFKKEARRLRKLNNKHIVRVYDLFEENDTAYYVMDFINGESLSSRLKKNGSPFSEKEVLKILDQILDTLEEVHKLNIWHLDLKPGNILINNEGNAVLIDFGASKQMSSSEGYETTTTSMCYTPGYAPSEQVDQNMDRIGPWTDLYALGATLYNLLTCSVPPTVSEIQEGNAFVFPSYISDKVKKLIIWLMSPARINRPQSVAEVRKFLLSDAGPQQMQDDEVTIVSPKVHVDNKIKEPISKPSDNNVTSSNNSNGGNNNSNGGLIIAGVIVGIFILIAIIIGMSSGNKAQQAPVDTDSIAEVVDSVVDSIAVVDSVVADSIVADDYWY